MATVETAARRSLEYYASNFLGFVELASISMLLKRI
jgi:hypothetical protein